MESRERSLWAHLAVLDRLAIEAALKASGGNREKAAAVLGVNRTTLWHKLRSAEAKDSE